MDTYCTLNSRVSAAAIVNKNSVKPFRHMSAVLVAPSWACMGDVWASPRLVGEDVVTEAYQYQDGEDRPALVMRCRSFLAMFDPQRGVCLCSKDADIACLVKLEHRRTESARTGAVRCNDTCVSVLMILFTMDR